MGKTIIAIDPGASGGIAWMHHGCRANSFKMPETPHDLVELLDSIAKQYPDPVECLLEDVHSMPNDSKANAFAFGRNFGVIIGVLAGLKIPYRLETPQSWQAKIQGKPGNKPLTKDKEKDKQIKAENKKARKDFMKAMAQARYPHLKVTLATADALAMLSTMADA